MAHIMRGQIDELFNLCVELSRREDCYPVSTDFKYNGYMNSIDIRVDEAGRRGVNGKEGRFTIYIDKEYGNSFLEVKEYLENLKKKMTDKAVA